MEDNIILKVKNLTVVLDNEKVIKDLSFQVTKGEILTIMGPNGAGKTVLLRTLLGFLPYQGQIAWKSNVKVGYLPQGLTQLKVKNLPLSVEEFFQLKNIPKKEIKKSLDLVGVKEKDFLKKQIGNLSGGQFQRMLIAWTLVDDPQVWICDEPTTGIDIGGETTIYSLLYKFWQQKQLTILIATHDLNIIYKYSHNVLCLNKETFCFGPPKEILTPQALERAYGEKISFYKHKH